MDYLIACLLFLISYHNVVSMRKDYTLNDFIKMGDPQKSYVLETWLMPNAWMNPSMIFDVSDQTKIIMVWRVPDLVRIYDRIVYRIM